MENMCSLLNGRGLRSAYEPAQWVASSVVVGHRSRRLAEIAWGKLTLIGDPDLVNRLLGRR
jgi:hypothetical protein